MSRLSTLLSGPVRKWVCCCWSTQRTQIPPWISLIGPSSPTVLTQIFPYTPRPNALPSFLPGGLTQTSALHNYMKRACVCPSQGGLIRRETPPPPPQSHPGIEDCLRTLLHQTRGGVRAGGQRQRGRHHHPAAPPVRSQQALLPWSVLYFHCILSVRSLVFCGCALVLVFVFRWIGGSILVFSFCSSFSNSRPSFYLASLGLNPHYYCMPILKTDEHRQSLRRAVRSGSSKFFLGTDSAPHSKLLLDPPVHTYTHTPASLNLPLLPPAFPSIMITFAVRAYL